MDLVELEARMTRMEDIEAIKQLKARYCEICDDDHDPDRITTIFAEDGIWEGEDVGQIQGQAAIRELFQTFQKEVKFSQHMVMNPIIEIDGLRATGVWYFFGTFTQRARNQARWVSARYDEDYSKVDGVWKFQHLRARIRMSTRFEKSWADKPLGV